MNDAADQYVAQGRARYIDLEEAKARIRTAEERGLAHLTIYNPTQHVYALCNCCACCCHDLQFLKRFHRPDMVAHADYIVEVDAGLCTQCGTCVKRCMFGARQYGESSVVFQQGKCYGCGVCVSTCPGGAIRMRLRD